MSHNHYPIKIYNQKNFQPFFKRTVTVFTQRQLQLGGKLRASLCTLVILPYIAGDDHKVGGVLRDQTREMEITHASGIGANSCDTVAKTMEQNTGRHLADTRGDNGDDYKGVFLSVTR